MSDKFDNSPEKILFPAQSRIRCNQRYQWGRSQTAATMFARIPIAQTKPKLASP